MTEFGNADFTTTVLGDDDLMQRSPTLTESFAECDLVFQITTGEVRKLNESATAIWRSLDQPRSLRELMALSGPNAGLATSDLHNNSTLIAEFCETMMRWGLIEVFAVGGMT